MNELPAGFEKNAKGFIREPLLPAKVTWTDAQGSTRTANGDTDEEFRTFWTTDTGEVVKWGRLLGVIGERAQKTMTLEGKWVNA